MHSADKSSIDALELRTFPLGQFDSLRPSAISKDSRGYLWLAGEDGLQRSDGYNWRRFSRDKIDKMVADQDAGLWLLTDQGLVYFDTISANAKLYQQEPGNLHGLPTKAINALLVDATGGLWLAHAQGLSYLAEGSDVFENYSLPSYGRDTIAGLSLCQHASGDIYVGSSAGVYVKRAASRNFKRLRYRTLQGAEQALAVNQLALVGDYIWAAGADFGLLRFRPSADLLISPELIQPADKLVGTQFSALLLPHPKQLWALSNNNGLFVFDAKTGAQLKHIEYQQLQDSALGSAQINAALYDNNGLVWLALENAAQLLGLIEINAGPSSPALVIAELKLGEKDQTLTLDTDFELALPNNSVSLALSALDFRTPEAIRFRYQLNRGPWVEMSAGERSIYLAAINPGRHQLTIQAADALGQWSADTLTRQFRVLPAWYQSLWFKIGAVLLLIALLVSVFTWYQRRLERHQLQMRMAIREQNRELENKNEELAAALEEVKQAQDFLVEREKMAALGDMLRGMAHEINTPIGVGMTAISDTVDRVRFLRKEFNSGSLSPEGLERFMNLSQKTLGMGLQNISRASELVETFKQVSVDCDETEAVYLTLHEQIMRVVSLELGIDWGGHQVDLDCPPNLAIKMVPAEFIQVFSNLLSNAMIHGLEVKAGGHIEIKVSIDKDEQLNIVVKDNGRGMSAETLKQVFTPFFTTRRGVGGLGLGLCQVYNLVVHKYQGQIYCDSLPGQGAAFYLCFAVPYQYQQGADQEWAKTAEIKVLGEADDVLEEEPPGSLEADKAEAEAKGSDSVTA